MTTAKMNFVLDARYRAKIKQLVDNGVYLTESEFLRVAVRERLEREPL